MLKDKSSKPTFFQHGSLNVPIEHHPTIRYMVYNGYYKVMSNIPKMGQLPTPVQSLKSVEPICLTSTSDCHPTVRRQAMAAAGRLSGANLRPLELQ